MRALSKSPAPPIINPDFYKGVFKTLILIVSFLSLFFNSYKVLFNLVIFFTHPTHTHTVLLGVNTFPINKDKS